MTDSSGSSDDDRVLFDIMESHDDSHNNIVCLFSMFVMECYDEDEAQYEYKHKWGGSPLGRLKKIERDGVATLTVSAQICIFRRFPREQRIHFLVKCFT